MSLPPMLQLALKRIDDIFMAAFTDAPINAAVMLDITIGDTPIWTRHYGNLPANESTIFRIGSNTKTFVSVMAHQLVEQGIIDLDEPMGRYIPGLEFNMALLPTQTTQPSIRELLSQLSGLPGSPPCTGSCNVTNAVMWKRLQNTLLQTPRGTVPFYSNLGFAIVGNALSSLVGMTFCQYVQKNIAFPLKMYSTGCEFTEAITSRMTPIYNNSYTLPDLGWQFPAGGMYSTITDMRKYAQGFLPGGKLFRHDATRTKILKPQYIAPDGMFVQGMPWEANFTNTYLLTKKGGKISVDSSNRYLYLSTLGFVSELNVLANVLTGLPNDDSSDARMRAAYAEMWDVLIPALNQYYATVARIPAAPAACPNLAGHWDGPAAFEIMAVEQRGPGTAYKIESKAIGLPPTPIAFAMQAGDMCYFRLKVDTTATTCLADMLSEQNDVVLVFERGGMNSTTLTLPGAFYGSEWKLAQP